MKHGRIMQGLTGWAESKGFEFLDGEKHSSRQIFRRILNDDIEQYLYLEGSTMTHIRMPQTMSASIRFRRINDILFPFIPDDHIQYPSHGCNFWFRSPSDCRPNSPIKTIADIDIAIARNEEHYQSFIEPFLSSITNLKDFYEHIENKVNIPLPIDYKGFFNKKYMIPVRMIMKAYLVVSNYHAYCNALLIELESSTTDEDDMSDELKTLYKSVLPSLKTKCDELYNSSKKAYKLIDEPQAPHILTEAAYKNRSIEEVRKIEDEKIESSWYWVRKYPEVTECFRKRRMLEKAERIRAERRAK